MTSLYAFGTDKGQRRSTNQDVAYATRIPDGRIVLILADGAGGMHGGETASTESVKTVKEYVLSQIGEEPEMLLRGAVVAANDRVRTLRQQEPALAAMATTLVVAIVDEDEAWVASLGDSRAYLYDGGELRQITEDDSLVAEQVRAGIITQEEADASPRQNVITRGIGVDEALENEPIVHERLGPGAVLLLCSDGLFRAVDDAGIMAALDLGNPERIVQRLIQAANEAGGPDNIGIALLRRDLEEDTEESPENAVTLTTPP